MANRKQRRAAGMQHTSFEWKGTPDEFLAVLRRSMAMWTPIVCDDGSVILPPSPDDLVVERDAETGAIHVSVTAKEIRP